MRDRIIRLTAILVVAAGGTLGLVAAGAQNSAKLSVTAIRILQARHRRLFRRTRPLGGNAVCVRTDSAQQTRSARTIESHVIESGG